MDWKDYEMAQEIQDELRYWKRAVEEARRARSLTDFNYMLSDEDINRIVNKIKSRLIKDIEKKISKLESEFEAL